MAGPGRQEASGRRPLDGIRVLDFTHVLAGPHATRILGDLGADVVKISSERRRSLTNDPDHPYFLTWNRSKRALALDLTHEDARKVCRRLCEKADVIIENFSVGVMERWDVGYESVRASNPSVIYLSMPGMGRDGPWAGFVTFAPTIHALSGLTYLTGVPGRHDIGIGFSYNDHQAGLHAVVAVLAALEARRGTGVGQMIELAQFELGVNLLGPALLDYFVNGRSAEPTGNRLPYDDAAPHNCYPCAGEDRWVAIAVMNDEQWQALQRVMGKPGWAIDERYHSATGRSGNALALDAHMAEWTSEMAAERVQALCQAAGVPAGVVQTGVDLTEHDAQMAHREFFRKTDTEHANAGALPIDRLPLRFSRTPTDYYTAPALNGDDNAAVLQEWLGMDEAEVRDGETSGAFR